MKTDGQIKAAVEKAIRELGATRTEVRAQGGEQAELVACFTAALWQLEAAQEMLRARMKAAKK